MLPALNIVSRAAGSSKWFALLPYRLLPLFQQQRHKLEDVTF